MAEQLKGREGKGARSSCVLLPCFGGWMLTVLAATFASIASTNAMADTVAMNAALHSVELEWARITYQMKSSDDQLKELAKLNDEVAKIVSQYPDRAEPLIWEGVILSSEAKYAGPFDALGFAKKARTMFEDAGQLDFRALDGAVPTSLGALYYKVPGFPIGFGNNSKARQLLEQGVEISPDGLDSNYFYGDFLYGQGEYPKAGRVLKHALATPEDPERPVWDAGRRAEIGALLKKIDEKTASDR